MTVEEEKFEEIIIGQIVSGQFGEILIRQKKENIIELGELLKIKHAEGYGLFQVSQLYYGSQIPNDTLELMAGLKLEGKGTNLEFYEPEIRNYVLAEIKGLLNIIVEKDKAGKKYKKISLPKSLPEFFSGIEKIVEKDLDFIKPPENPLYLGKIRSGSKILNVDVSLSSKDVLKHHILIPATTGRGKSNLVKVMISSVMKNGKCGILVLDPHNEYYGVNETGLKDISNAKDYLKYYTPTPGSIPGAISLIINLKDVRARHINQILSLTDAQEDTIFTYETLYKKEWLEKLMEDDEPPVDSIKEITLKVTQRKVGLLLNILKESISGTETLKYEGIFQKDKGEATISNILKDIEEGKTVIVDTSTLSGNLELFINTIIVEKIFTAYRNYKMEGSLKDKPIVSIIIEEAPRVIGKDVLEHRENIFGTIAKEGRKFQVGLIAITQLPSIIAREILANMNTKIILGNEMGPERRAIIESSAQDLSKDTQAIASLDIGEAIITSNFTKFAVPIKIPMFNDYIKELNEKEKKKKIKKSLPGVS